MHDYLDDHQIKAVEALQEVKIICEKHHIAYFLLAGAALGAIRHEGFIPWDDDIDIGVVYQDWYKLRKILIDELPSDFIYMDNIRDANFPRFFGKILYHEKGVIDVFIIVKWSTNKLMGNIFWQIERMGSAWFNISIHYKPSLIRVTTFRGKFKHYVAYAFRRITYFPIHFIFGRDDFIKLIRWCEKRFMNSKTDYYINFYSVYSMEREMIKKEWLLNPSKVIFEGEEYPTVSDTNAYLTHLYGDYMTLPPIEKRVKLHDEILM